MPDKLDPLEWGRYNNTISRRSLRHAGAVEFTRSSAALLSFMKIADLEKPSGDTLSALRTLQRAIYDSFEYKSGITEVHSPIETALEHRLGVCQDFAHIMIAVGAPVGRAYPLCLRLSLSQGLQRPLPRRRHPCLGGVLSAVAGLGRL